MKRKALIWITSVVVVMVVVSTFSVIEYVNYPYPPETVSAQYVSQVLNSNFTKSKFTVNSWHVQGMKITGAEYFGRRGELDLFVIQCSNDTTPVNLFHTFLKLSGNVSIGSNVSYEGKIAYNYSNITFQGVVHYSRLSGYKGDVYILLQTQSGFTIPSNQMLSIFNEQWNLVNATNPYF